MKKLIALGLTLSLLVSCHKKDETPTVTLCDSDYCKQYYTVWKNLFLKKNNMSEDYFTAHITPFYTGISNWNSGSSFNIRYTVDIEWMSCSLSDQFMIRTAPTETVYPLLDVPRGVYLNQDQVQLCLDIMAFSSEMNTVRPIEHLSFGSLKEALNYMETQANVKKFENARYSYDKSNMNVSSDGLPYLTGGAETSKQSNECISAKLNLLSKSCSINKGLCRVN